MKKVVASLAVAGTLLLAAPAFAVLANTPAQREKINMQSSRRWCRMHKPCAGTHLLFSISSATCTVTYAAAYTKPETTLLKLIVCKPKKR